MIRIFGVLFLAVGISFSASGVNAHDAPTIIVQEAIACFKKGLAEKIAHEIFDVMNQKRDPSLIGNILNENTVVTCAVFVVDEENNDDVWALKPSWEKSVVFLDHVTYVRVTPFSEDGNAQKRPSMYLVLIGQDITDAVDKEKARAFMRKASR